MKNLIIISGNCGTTLKAGKFLASKLDNADIFDTLSPISNFDFSGYDNYIFGANIRMFMLNGRFKKYASRLKKYYTNKNSYGFLIGGMKENDKKLMSFFKKN